MTEKANYSEAVDIDRLEYAMELFKGASEGESPVRILQVGLRIMQFGGISVSQMLAKIETDGE